MPLPSHCIECDKVATVLDDSVPYCAQCYMKEVMHVKSNANKKTFNKMLPIKNPNSYYAASHDARNDASTYLIMTRMIEDIMKNLDRWTTLSYIQEHGKTATRTQKEAAMYESNFTNENGEEQSGFTMYNGDEVEFDHIVPKSEGGTGEEGNL